MSERVHASCVALDGRAVLLLGPSGSGKSSVAVQMIGMGADLVADDQVLVEADGDTLRASAPEGLAGLIEVRGVGLVRLAHVVGARIIVAVDLATERTERLPELAQTEIAAQSLPLISGRNRPYLASELMAFLRAGLDPLIHDPNDGGVGANDR